MSTFNDLRIAYLNSNNNHNEFSQAELNHYEQLIFKSRVENKQDAHAFSRSQLQEIYLTGTKAGLYAAYTTYASSTKKEREQLNYNVIISLADRWATITTGVMIDALSNVKSKEFTQMNEQIEVIIENAGNLRKLLMIDLMCVYFSGWRVGFDVSLEMLKAADLNEVDEAIQMTKKVKQRAEIEAFSQFKYTLDHDDAMLIVYRDINAGLQSKK